MLVPKPRSLPTQQRSKAINTPKSLLPKEPLLKALRHGYDKRRPKGWRARDLGFDNPSKCRSEAFQRVIADDSRVLDSFLAGIEAAGMKMPNRYNEKNGTTGMFKTAKRTVGSTLPVSLRYLAFAWGVGKNYPRVVRKKLDVVPGRGGVSDAFVRERAPFQSVIVDREKALRYYSPKQLFVNAHVKEQNSEMASLSYDHTYLMRSRHLQEAESMWETLSDDEKTVWACLAREHDERQPLIRDQILDAIRANPTKSFEQISTDVGCWCSSATIHRWLQSQETYSTYVERVLPLLTKHQMNKHVEFAQLLRTNWNLPPGRTLWINYDEKWFYGFVARTSAKMCEQLGLEKQAHYLYHKNHIDKVMCMAITGFAFEETPENGGVGIKIGFHRCEAAWIAKKRQQESRKDEEDRTRYDGRVIRKKGEAYMVDCNVTGSNEGTSDAPKYAIQRLFKDIVFPKIQELVAAGAKFEGYQVIIQGNNAGPQTDADYVAFCMETCEDQGWHWQPQAP